MYRTRIVVVALAATFPFPVAADEPPPDAASAAAKTATAAASQPQLPLFRGGSLGVPTPSASTSVQAAAIGTLAGEKSEGNSTADFDFFTKVGGIVLDETFSAEAVGESFKLDLPRGTVGMAGTLLTATTTEVTSAGLRITYRPSARTYKIFTFDPVTDAAKQTDGAISATARQLFEGATGWAVSVGGRVLHPVLPGIEATNVEGGAAEVIVQRTKTRASSDDSCKRAKDAQEVATAKSKQTAAVVTKLVANESSSTTITLLGTKGVPAAQATTALEDAAAQVTAQAAADTAVSAALERACKLADRRSTFFGSLTATYLTSQRLPMADDPTRALVVPRVIETRATIGWERQSGREQLGLLLPRVGAYAALSHANWHNPYATTPEQLATDDISDWQGELAIYASGHFSGGFGGLISVGVLAPYGNGRELQAFINVVPSIGAAIGGAR